MVPLAFLTKTPPQQILHLTVDSALVLMELC